MCIYNNTHHHPITSRSWLTIDYTIKLQSFVLCLIPSLSLPFSFLPFCSLLSLTLTHSLNTLYFKLRQLCCIVIAVCLLMITSGVAHRPNSCDESVNIEREREREREKKNSLFEPHTLIYLNYGPTKMVGISTWRPRSLLRFLNFLCRWSVRMLMSHTTP